MPIPDTAAPPAYSRTLAPGAAAGLAATEWLLTDGQGGFAMGSVAGIPTRRYHGWLIAATMPPVGRVVALHSCVETLIENPGAADERRHDLSTFAFAGGTLHPSGVRALRKFEDGSTCRWEYQLGDDARPIRISRTLCLNRESGRGAPALAACSVRYEISAPGRRIALHVRPLIALRDFHGLLHGRSCHNRFAVSTSPGVVTVQTSPGFAPQGLRVNLACDTARFSGDGQWWYDFEYARELERSQDSREDLWSPGAFIIEPPRTQPPSDTHTAELIAWVGAPDQRPKGNGVQWARQHSDREHALLRESLGASPPPRNSREAGIIAALVAAGDRFIVRRDLTAGSSSISVIAGYPWFGDWGRDTMICIPGLMLAAGRFAEAKRTLETFAALCKNGLIPNWFDDRTGQAEYNTVDAALWFVHAACRYAKFSGDSAALRGTIGKACREIIDHYRRGTDHNIKMDSDGLISAGTPDSQLTWMDAKRDGFVFTPRHGKPVEINALWYNALESLAAALTTDDPKSARELHDLAHRVGTSFREKFWNPRSGSCYDVLTPDAAGGFKANGPGHQARPNQIFAASLPYSPLTKEQRVAVVEFVRQKLLTPLGLRSLSPGDPGYIGRFKGSLFERDRAYHNGTVWPWLLGAFAEATMRTADFSPESCAKAKDLLLNLVGEMDSPNPGRLLGHIPEVYDGDERPEAPRQPGGCVAQAWSIAETLRVYDMAVRGRDR